MKLTLTHECVRKLGDPSDIYQDLKLVKVHIKNYESANGEENEMSILLRLLASKNCLE